MSCFKSSFELLEFLLYEIFWQNSPADLQYYISWYINSMKCRPNPDFNPNPIPNRNPKPVSFHRVENRVTRNSTRNSTRWFCRLNNKQVIVVRRPGCGIRCPCSLCWWVLPEEWRAGSSDGRRQIWGDVGETAVPNSDYNLYTQTDSSDAQLSLELKVRKLMQSTVKIRLALHHWWQISYWKLFCWLSTDCILYKSDADFV